MDDSGASRPTGFAGFKQRLARSAAGLNALLTDDAVRDKAGALLQGRLNRAVERGQAVAGQQLAGVRTGLRGVLAKVAEADALRALRRRTDEDDLIDLQVGSTVYEDVPPEMRERLWRSLLDQAEASARSSARAGPTHETLDDMEVLICGGDYYSSLTAGLAASNVGSAAPDEFIEDIGAVIARDISRTFPKLPQFRAAEGRAQLQRVLHAYAIHDPAVGYCQGMAFVAGSLLMRLDESHAFAALVALMHGAGMRTLYLPGMAGLQLRLRQLEELLRRRAPRLAAHLATHDVSPVIYASAWFLSFYAADFAPAFTQRLLDVALAERSSAVAVRVALGLLDAAEEALLQLDDFEALVMYIKLELKELPKARLREILTLSIGMEGVNDATLAALAEDIARDDAASAATRASPRRSKAAADAGAGEAAAGDDGEGDEEEVGGDDLDAQLQQGPPGARHHRGRSSSSVLNMLLDLDLGLPPAEGDDDEADEWVSVVPPMAGGTRGVAPPGAALPPAPAAGSALARPSLRMLAAQQPGAAAAGDEPDLICLSSPTASAHADAT